MTLLGVNIDHIATVRQARRIDEPDPVLAAGLAELGGADNITVHLRKDRRHIQDRDVALLRQSVHVRLNLEMSLDPEIVALALKTRPPNVCIVPENRQEVTTEGGLDVAGQLKRVAAAVKKLQRAGSVVSLFVDPEPRQIDAAAAVGATHVELHTGDYASAFDRQRTAAVPGRAALEKLTAAAVRAGEHGLRVNAGHGLNYRNVLPVAAIPGMEELNIGHSIVGRALFVGLREAVREMKQLIQVRP
ncbi:MAG: pyridoxine 5'-phosphate synthase [Planctomycetota bacterium]